MLVNINLKALWKHVLFVSFAIFFMTGCDIGTEPIATIKVDKSVVFVNENIVFDGSNSSSGVGNIVSYHWEDEAHTLLSTKAKFSHAFVHAGTHILKY